MIVKVKFLETIRKNLGFGIREIARALGTSHTMYLHWVNKGKKAKEFMRILTKMRRVSGLTWDEYGNMLDDEFFEEK